MLRIVDARTGRTVPAAPVRRGPTRVLAQPPGPDTTGLRVLLVADLLARALELDGTPAWALRSGADGGHRLREEAEALGIRPFEDVGSAGPGAGQTVHIVGEDTTVPEGTVVAVAPATPSAPDLSHPDALRLALLAQSHHARVRLDASALGEARDTLARWRRAVAAWARRPSRPVPGEVRDRLRAAWRDDVDAPGVLRVLRAVETDPDLPDGARFETFAHADRFLGLHLARDVGAPD